MFSISFIKFPFLAVVIPTKPAGFCFIVLYAFSTISPIEFFTVFLVSLFSLLGCSFKKSSISGQNLEYVTLLFLTFWRICLASCSVGISLYCNFNSSTFAFSVSKHLSTSTTTIGNFPSQSNCAFFASSKFKICPSFLNTSI